MNNNDFVSIDWVVNRLGLSDMPKKHSYEIIADNVTKGCFEMYFDEPVVGTDAFEDVGMVYDGKGRFVGYSIDNGYSIEHSGRKKATGVDVDHSDGAFKFAVNDYYFHGKRFYPTDTDGEWHKSKFVNVNLVSFDENQIDSFKPPKNFSRPKGEQGLLKALALLAREMADKRGAKYKTGNKVNASEFKEHLLSLAKKYEISDGLLNSLDDKVSKALEHLELKEIPPDKK